MGTRRNWRKNKSTVFEVPALVGLTADASNALRVGKNQIHDANAFAQSVGCGEPFGNDGKPVMDRATKRQYMQELNKRRADEGEARLVNFDGGYGDET